MLAAINFHAPAAYAGYLAGLASALLLVAVPAQATASELPVALELVLAVDASSSIQSEEFDLQVQGYANAFRDPAVIASIQDLGEAGIAVTLVQWSAGHQMYQSVPWTHVYDAASGEGLARAIERNFWSFTAFGTALGGAIEFSLGLFAGNGFAGQRQTIDISADERANTGKHPSQTQPLARAAGVTVNGLVVLDTELDLPEYFRNHVIVGEDAFVEVVEKKTDLARSIIRKLVREISGRPVAQLELQSVDLSRNK